MRADPVVVGLGLARMRFEKPAATGPSHGIERVLSEEPVKRID
jgi:hypothetical protein